MSAARLDLVPGTCALTGPPPRPSEMTCDPPQSAGIRRALSPGPPLAGALLLETSIPRPLHSWPLDPFPRLLNAEPARLQTGCKALQRGKRFSEKSEASPSSKPGVSAGRFRLTIFVLDLCSLRWRTWSPVLSCWSYFILFFFLFFIYSSSAIDEVSHGVLIWFFASLLSATDRSSACLLLLLPCLCLALPCLPYSLTMFRSAYVSAYYGEREQERDREREPTRRK